MLSSLVIDEVLVEDPKMGKEEVFIHYKKSFTEDWEGRRVIIYLGYK